MMLMTVLDDLAFIEGREEDLSERFAALRDRGSFGSEGVRGQFKYLVREDRPGHLEGMAMVYAEVAHQFGWLRPGRPLSAAEYDQLRTSARSWTEEEDRTTDDVVATFGAPSIWREGYNPWWDTSFGYCTASSAEPIIVFDFWQETDWGHRPRTSPLGERPLVRDVRWTTEGDFRSDFTFSPRGAARILEQENVVRQARTIPSWNQTR
jgi:hypothetical protein